jgi:HK97 family phage major capsid protein
MIEKEIQLELRTARLFKEMAVNSKTTVIPLQTDVNEATWSTGGENASASSSVFGTNVTNRDDTNPAARTGYLAKQKILTVDRLISTTYMDNYVDEEVLVNLMPMLTQGIARAHARAVDKAILQGNGGGAISGLNTLAVAKEISWSSGSAVAITARDLVSMRATMGVYGLNPQDLVFIVSQSVYHDLINDAEFDNVFEVGSDAALKLTGQVGQVYGTPVVISDNFPAVTPSAGQNVGAFCVNPSNFIIPRLRGVSIEQDYEVAAQRRLIVGSQHLGFDELFDSVAGKAAAVRLNVKA